MWHTAIKHFKSELVQDKETTMMDVYHINFYANFKLSCSDFIDNGLQITLDLTLDQKWAGDSMTIYIACCIPEVLAHLNKVFCILTISTMAIVYFVSTK